MGLGWVLAQCHSLTEINLSNPKAKRLRELCNTASSRITELGSRNADSNYDQGTYVYVYVCMCVVSISRGICL